ncbi:hypothetical protein FA95DRAFT_1548568 [Auriscalpium vulgare]|uniref:Uncharacterized protein n=1 Tax=Auriscalpium vulgare TaxID=40419 RepID=A0ACB8RDB8_9AGAM|nr:hypothetical protein FA95DRAFT_1548568 [Auriscalpium vulgare]
MENEVKQLVEMVRTPTLPTGALLIPWQGATAAQARAALKRYKDVMQAAERIFDGAFDDVVDDVDDGDVSMASAGPSGVRGRDPVARLATPEDEDDVVEDTAEGSDDEDDYGNYDSDYEIKDDSERERVDIDPYAGVFFSKDRREEVIEVEEQSEVVHLLKENEDVSLLTQSQWMKGCPEGGEQSFLFSLFTQLSQGSCPCPHGCGSSVPRQKSDFFAIFPTFAQYIAHLRGLVRQKCKKCSKDFCLACGEPCNTPRSQLPADTLDDPDLFHCSNLQGVILGIGLAMLEQLYDDQTQTPSGSQDGRVRTNKRKKTPVTAIASPHDIDDDDDNYLTPPGQGKKSKVGIGYAGDLKEDTTGQAEAQAVQRAKDERLGTVMTSLRIYLPSLQRPGGGRTSDYLVHPTALAHLRRRFNTLCTSLLRNDSLTDMSDRSAVYFELFEWLETISNHEALASMMAMPIMVVASVKTSSPKRSANGSPPLRERAITYEGSSGPRELLEAIVIQAQAAIKGLEGTKPAEAPAAEMTEEQKRVTHESKGKEKEVSTSTLSEENQKLLTFCHRILATAQAIDRSLRETKGEKFLQRLHDSLPKIFTSSSIGSEGVYVAAGASEEVTKKAYVEWATRVRFEYCDLEVPLSEEEAKKASADEPPNYKFYFNSEARMLATSDIPKRSLAIAKELAVLTTNLPVAWDSSIFLRVDETRVDIIKALIIGPEGTPYQNGCFQFDIFLGHAYNQAPPSVKYMTTNGGKFRFNPNLYADGKVCLSLLGTWSGPGWVSGKSTLLQVLISIQSMILCEEPYLNEPGWASSAGTPQSTAYSGNVRRMVVKTAMLGNLKAPPEPFADIIRTHFRLKAKSIGEQLDKWLAQDDGKATAGDGAMMSRGAGGASSNGLQADVEELKRMMQRLQTEGAGAPAAAAGSSSSS